MMYLQGNNVTPDLLRKAYGIGIFPMAEGAGVNDLIYWYQPNPRSVLIPGRFHVPRRLGRLLRRTLLRPVWNDDFRAVMQACAERDAGNWINPVLIEAYTQLHEEGEAFCLSLFDGDRRVGGIYGVQWGGMFMAESMFSRISNASSLALVVLMAGLTRAGIELVDVQFSNPHTEKFGVIEIDHAQYMTELRRLENKAVQLKADYFCLAEATLFVQSLSHTS